MACKKKELPTETLANQDIIAVRTVIVGKNTAAEPVLASGLVASATEARLSFKTGGVIEKIYVKEGDAVRKGQLLARLNLTEINAQVNQVKESVAKVERDLARVQNLYKDSVATLEQLQNITTAYNVAKQNLAIAQFNQNFSEIHATSNGRIIKKIMNDGELVGPGMPVFYMTANGAQDWVVRIGVSDKDWTRLKLGDQAKITLDAFKNETFGARITNLAQSIDPTSGLYQVELKLNNNAKMMATGLFASVTLQPSTTRSYMTIPLDALIEGNGNNAFVYVNENGIARKKVIQTARIVQDNVLVVSGLKEGEQVITDGSAYLVDGVKVK
jgi:RND family efflux transporter MFP subunit